MTTQPIPWSAGREDKLRRKIGAIWIEMWIAVIIGIAGLTFANIYHKSLLFPIAGVGFGWALGSLAALNRKRSELGEEMRRLPGGQFFEGSGMLANKPRSTANLTPWLNYPADSFNFICSGCGRIHEWAKAEWIPNYDLGQFHGPRALAVDPGAGRFVILCPCGLGHYKLKA